MRYDQKAVQEAQRRAFNSLASRFTVINDFDETGNPKTYAIKNENYTPGIQVTAPAKLIQEQAFVNTRNSFVFDFSLTAPQSSPVLNNVLLGKNNRFQSYGIQFLIGEGAAANNRIYRGHGIIPNDDSIYNSTMKVEYENSAYQDLIDMQDMRDVENNGTDYSAYTGFTLINPQRAFNGGIGVLRVTITLINSISALVLSPDLFLSVRLVGALGQPQGGR